MKETGEAGSEAVSPGKNMRAGETIQYQQPTIPAHCSRLGVKHEMGQEGEDMP